ncbi:small basic family protein [bacterium]|nr:small basic family protein [bacterium]
MVFLVPLFCLLVSFLIVYFSHLAVPLSYAPYLSVAILASLDSIMGGIRSALERKFDNFVFLSGFFVNSIAAAILVWIGDILGVALYFAAVVAFGVRIFQNLSLIRRLLLRELQSGRDDSEREKK